MELFPLWMTTFPLPSNKPEQGCCDGGENAADWTHHSSHFYYLMGSAVSRISERRGAAAQRRLSLGILKNMRVSVSQRLGRSALFSQPVQADCRPPVPELLLAPEDKVHTSEMDLTSVFLPEFPQHVFPEPDHFKILGLVAKGSYGPILRVKDMFKDKVFAVKVLPKSKIIEDGLVEQLKEEVHHSVCSYCSFGDLYTYWLLKGQFGEKEIRLFAAELGCALGFLHDLGIIHRDVKMENILLSDQGHLRLSDFGLSRRLKRGGRAFTVCGTIQYMAPEVLSGGPYSHAADWWSLGIMLFSLVTGEFPVPAELDHITMLKEVADCAYVLPKSYSSALVLLLTELLCKDPARRLRNLECFEMQPFFHGSSFDPLLLQKTPVDVILKLRNHSDWTAKATRGCSLDDFDNFLCNEIICSSASYEPSPTSSNMDLRP